jgi:dipeptidyl aminopeptidase/acylaminoacyl peptidase
MPAQGYAVVMIDFHGSTGYGQAFTDAISQHWGDRPLEDLQKGWAYRAENYPFLDGDRAGALGASYGGYMVNWIAGNWQEPWKCLVTHDGVFDTRDGLFHRRAVVHRMGERHRRIQGTRRVRHLQPHDHVAKDWSVPMLVVHSDKDYRIPLEQGIGVFTACQAKGIESRSSCASPTRTTGC